MELLSAMALASAGTALILGWPGAASTPADAREVAEVAEVDVDVDVDVAVDVELEVEADVDASRSACAWDPVRALGYVPVGPSRVVTAAARPVSVPLTLEPDPRACHELREGRCAAGCFEIMATRCDGAVGPLTVEVTPAGEPDDVIAASLEPGASAAAGFCYGFPLGQAGRMDVVARVTTSRGQGPISIAAWRHRDPDLGAGGEPTATLRLPSLGTPQAELLARFPRCAEEWDAEAMSCRFHGAVGSFPLSQICEDGCSWWTYRVEAGALAAVELKREIADVDEELFGRFADEAGQIAALIDRRYGALSRPEELGTWAEVEARSHEGRYVDVPLQRRVWARPDARTSWELDGVAGHHAVARLRVTVTRPAE